MTKRQRQFPYQPSVGPVNNPLFLQEFETGRNGAVAAAFRNASVPNMIDLPTELQAWSPNAAQTPFPPVWLDAIRKAGWAQMNQPASAGPGLTAFAWGGAVAPLPAPEPEQDGNYQFEVYGRVGLPEVDQDAPVAAPIYAAILLGQMQAVPVLVDAPFIAIGMEFADGFLPQISKWSDSVTPVDEESAAEACCDPAVYVRAIAQYDALVDATLVQMWWSPTGWAWRRLGQQSISGEITSIGYGCSGVNFEDGASVSGAFALVDFIRAVQVPRANETPTTTTGGQNYPGAL